MSEKTTDRLIELIIKIKTLSPSAAMRELDNEFNTEWQSGYDQAIIDNQKGVISCPRKIKM